jgi:hypothetical protein
MFFFWLDMVTLAVYNQRRIIEHFRPDKSHKTFCTAKNCIHILAFFNLFTANYTLHFLHLHAIHAITMHAGKQNRTPANIACQCSIICHAS